LDAVRFQTLSSNPARARFAAIREPMIPSPRKAIARTHGGHHCVLRSAPPGWRYGANTSARERDRAVVVAVPFVRVVQVPVGQVVQVVAVGHLLMPAASPVHVARLVRAAVVLRCTRSGVSRVNREYVLIDVALVRVVHVSVVEIVRMTLVSDRGMSAAWAVLVLVALVDLMLLVVHAPNDKRGVAQVAPRTRRRTDASHQGASLDVEHRGYKRPRSAFEP
jgi:hypothetical protein